MASDAKCTLLKIMERSRESSRRGQSEGEGRDGSQKEREQGRELAVETKGVKGENCEEGKGGFQPESERKAGEGKLRGGRKGGREGEWRIGKIKGF